MSIYTRGLAQSLTQGGTGLNIDHLDPGSLLIGNNAGSFSVNPLTAGPGISLVNGDGVITISATGLTNIPPATASVLGGVKIGSNISVAVDGAISVASPYVLPIASSTVLGGIKSGTGLSIDGSGILSSRVKQVIVFQPATDLYVSTAFQTSPGSTNPANYALLQNISITVAQGSSIFAYLIGAPYNWLTGTGNWLYCGLALNGLNLFPSFQANYSGSGAGPFNVQQNVAGYWSNKNAGSYNVNIYAQAGGPGGVTQSAGWRATPTSSGNSYLTVIVIEFS